MPRYPLAQVLASNARLKDPNDAKFGRALVGLFVGGTSGIGETTLKAFADSTISPRIYVVGRNQDAYNRIEGEVKTINPEAKLKFLPADCSELKEVDRVCAEVVKLEEAIAGAGKAKLNFLVLTIGFFSINGRTESPEGLDRKMTCNYYSRLRFVDRLQPLLNTAAAAGKASGVLSVLAARKEGSLDFTDLDLKNTFSLGRCLAHCAAMMTLSFEELAKVNEGTAYVHTAPGAVRTKFMRPLEKWWISPFLPLLYLAIKPWETSFEESGQRHLFMGLSGQDIFVPRRDRNKGGDIAIGSDGTPGSGSYALESEGQSVENGDSWKKLRADGAGQKVIEHTQGVFARIEKLNAERKV